MSEIAYCDKYSCFGYGIGFDTRGLSDGIGFSKNVRLFGVDNSFPVHADNRTKDILVLGKGLIDGLDDTVLTAEFCLSLHYNGSNSFGCSRLVGEHPIKSLSSFVRLSFVSQDWIIRFSQYCIWW